MVLTRTQAQELAPNWRLVLGQLHLAVDCGGFADALAFVQAVGELAERLDHHPEVDLRFNWVHLSCWSHDVGRVTQRDIRFANAVDEIVAAQGFRVAHERTSVVEIGIDVSDVEACLRFWQAVTGYRRRDEVHLVDEQQRGPVLWFQQLDEPRPQRNTMHLDWNVPHDLAGQRVADALAAGGVLVTDEFAPSWWVLADPEGNEVCICTWQGRDEAPGPDKAAGTLAG